MKELSKTKELIFDVFVEMVSTLGYENVSMRDIADKVGIKVASIYNHFETKGEILAYTYNYYEQRQYNSRKPVDEMKKLIETAGAEEIVDTFFYTFSTDDQKMYTRMILITKIIYMRLFQDPAANAMFIEKDINNTEYVIDVLKHGIETGRIESGFDIQTFADVLVGSMMIMGIKAFARPAYTAGPPDEQNRTLALLARLLDTALK